MYFCVNVYVSLCVSICMRLYSTVSLVVRDIALYKCTLLLLLLLLLLLYQASMNEGKKGVILFILFILETITMNQDDDSGLKKPKYVFNLGRSR